MTRPEAQAIGVLELRQYTLRPGQCERLVTLFDRAFVESQEALGIVLPGQFRDLDDPDRFVWLRGFADLDERVRALAVFYDGPVWLAHRDAANATMIDSDDVLLLQPRRPFDLTGLVRPAPGAIAPAGLVMAMVCPLKPGTERAQVQAFETRLWPRLETHGARLLASCTSEPARNGFPRLPVREDERVFVWMAAFDNEDVHARWQQSVAADPATAAALAEWLAALDGNPQTLRLVPAPRSLLRGLPASVNSAASIEASA